MAQQWNLMFYQGHNPKAPKMFFSHVAGWLSPSVLSHCYELVLEHIN